MPTPLIPLTIQGPGYKGLNIEESDLALDTGWATELQNCIFSESGRVCSRNGHTYLSTSDTDFQDNSPTVMHAFEASVGTEVITAGLDDAAHKIYRGTTSLTDLTGILSPTGSNWQFVNFTDSAGAEKIVGVQEGHEPIRSTASAGVPQAFETIPGATVPASGKAVLSAFGRIWIIDDDGQQLHYSSLLDENDFSTTGGVINMEKYWPGGIDHGCALVTWEDKIVVFGQHSTLIYASAFTPNSIVLWDTIDGMGCVARDTVQSVGSDVLFLSESGVRSIRKTIVEGKVPLSDVSSSVRTRINTLTDAATKTSIKSVYSQIEGFYLLIYADDDVVYNFDVQNIELSKALPEAEQVKVSKWTDTSITCGCYGRDEITYFGVPTTSGHGRVASYGGFLDGTSTYTMVYESPWIDLSSAEAAGTWTKIAKKATATVAGNSTYTVQLSLAYDFGLMTKVFTKAITVGSGTGAEYSAAGGGLAEYGISEYGGSTTALGQLKYNVTGTGQFFKVGLQCTIDGFLLSLPQIDVFFKKGRISR